MTQVIYMMPKCTRLFWDPSLEPLNLEDEPGVEIPLLGYVSAGRPVETPEEQHETIRVPSHVKTREIVYLLFKQPWAPLLPILQGLNGREMA